MITLRDYQSDGIAKIRQSFVEGFKAPLYVLPTGGGKTTVFAHIAESSEKRGKRVLIMCHRIELVDQIVDRLRQFDVDPDIIAATYTRRAGRVLGHARHSVAVASVPTLVRRLDVYAPPTLLICDEAHHLVEGGTFSTIVRKYDKAKLLGTTATPMRADGRGLAKHFDKLIVGPLPEELIQMGFLASPKIYAPPTVDTSGLHIRAGEFKSEESEALIDTPSITGDAFSHYRKHADGKQALVFCTSVAHAHHVAERFRKENISALALDGGTDKEIRRMAMQDFKDGKIRVITNCELFGEGLDIVGVECGIFLRPTASLGLFLQQCGRILRPAPNKPHAILLDHVGNTQRHGLPTEPREWELTDDVVRRKKKPPPGVRVCPKCFAASPARATRCTNSPCPHVFEVKGRSDIAEKEGELVEMTAEQIAKKKERREQGRAQTLEQLIAFGKSKGYAPGWAIRLHEARLKKRANKDLRRMQDGETVDGVFQGPDKA